MRLLLIGLILLAFPVLEISILIKLGSLYGWWLIFYLVVIAMLGWRLMKDEQLMMLGRMAQTMSQGGTPTGALFGSVKNMIAGILLIIPGVLTDSIAVVLLLLPAGGKLPNSNQRWSNRAANDDIIEGEFHREEEVRPNSPHLPK